MKKRNIILTLLSIGILVLFLLYAKHFFDSYMLRFMNLCAIYTILGLSMNLVNGFTGLFSLGQAGFMAVGAYTSALLTMSVSTKQQIFYLTPLVKPLDTIVLPFAVALLVAGIVAAVMAFLIGAPALRLKGDYLAIATLGFGEIIRIVILNAQGITNGALGLKGIPTKVNLWWSFGIAAAVILFMVSLIKSSYGRAFKAIREDEIAAESMGVNLFRHKVLSFAIGAFFAGVGGGMLSNLQGATDPQFFNFTLTFNIMLIIVLGGMGSITGTVIAAFIVTIGNELLTVLDKPINLVFVTTPAIPGMRAVVFSALLMAVVLFYRKGLMGSNEFNWDKLIQWFSRKPLAKGGTK